MRRLRLGVTRRFIRLFRRSLLRIDEIKPSLLTLVSLLRYMMTLPRLSS